MAEKRKLAIGAAALAAVLLVALVAWLVWPSGSGDTPDDDPGVATGATAAPAPSTAPVIESWGMDGSLLSVMVRNDDVRTIRMARVRLDVFDAAGKRLLTGSPDPMSKCCTIHNLPTDQKAALFLDMARIPGKVARVEAAYTEVTYAPQGARDAFVEVQNTRLRRTADDAIVTARLHPRRISTAYVAGQAFLGDASGKLVAVISGHLYCFTNNRPQDIRMALTRPVPPGTVLLDVVAYPVPPEAVADSVPDCTGSTT